jgi:protein-S-isoprenylcysteine O-methyltransferase Ste14
VKKDIDFVLIQFVLFALYVIDFNLIDYSIDVPAWIDILLIVIGLIAAMIITMGIINLNKNLTPFPTPRKNSSLISNGIYGYIRHPIYTGIILAMFSYSLYSNSLGRFILAIILYGVFYFKSEYEEKLLVQKFPDYLDYRKRTGRFFPRLRKK